MKTCQTAQEMFRLIGIGANKVFLDLYEFMHILAYILFIISFFVYLIRVAETAQEYTEMIFLTSIIILILVTYMTFKFTSHTIFNIFDEIEQAVNSRLEHSEAMAMYEKTNQIVEKYCKFIAVLWMFVIVPLLTFPNAVHSFLVYFTTDSGNDAFELPISMCLPFDWKNPIGYLISVAVQVRMAVLASSDCACVWTFVLSSFLFAITTAKDLKRSLKKINKNVKAKKTRLHVMEQLTCLLKFYSRIKRIADDFSRVCQIPLTGFFVTNTTVMCITLLMIQLDLVQSYNDIDSVMLLKSTFISFWAVVAIFTVYEFSQRYSNAFGDIEEVFDQFNWYLLPIEIKRILPAIILYVQQPIEIRFFGSLSCSREQFKRMIKSTWSFFMVIREFYQ